jgi:hypothetical protein
MELHMMSVGFNLIWIYRIWKFLVHNLEFLRTNKYLGGAVQNPTGVSGLVLNPLSP